MKPLCLFGMFLIGLLAVYASKIDDAIIFDR